MPNSFTIARSRLSAASSPDLRKEIDGHTGSEAQTSSILRSIERFGGDATIDRFEVVPSAQTRARFGSNAVSWTVRGVR